jgi:hypothetical protein
MDAVSKTGRGDFWKPDKGLSVIRVLPGVGEMIREINREEVSFFFQEVGKHYSLPDDSSEFCPLFTTAGEYECPICDLVGELYKAGDKDRAGKLRVRKGYWVNVIVRDPDDQGGTTGNGPKIYTPGVTVFKYFQGILTNPDYGEFYDPYDGVDLVVEKKGEGLDTEYNVTPRRDSSPIHVDEDLMEKWLDEAIDLSWVMLSDDPAVDQENSEDAVVILLPYDRLLEKHGLGPGVDVSAMDVKEEAKKSEPADEVEKVINQRRQRRSRR